MQQPIVTRIAAGMIVVGMAAPAFKFLVPGQSAPAEPVRLASVASPPSPTPAVPVDPENAEAVTATLDAMLTGLPEGYQEAYRTTGAGPSPWDASVSDCTEPRVDLPTPKAQVSAIHAATMGGLPVLGTAAAVFDSPAAARTAAGSADGNSEAGRCWHEGFLRSFLGDEQAPVEGMRLASSKSETRKICVCGTEATLVIHRYVVEMGGADPLAMTIYVTAWQIDDAVMLVTTQTAAQPNTEAETQVRMALLKGGAKHLVAEHHAGTGPGAAPATAPIA